MRVIAHGFGMFPLLLEHLIDQIDDRTQGLEWAVVLPTSHHRVTMARKVGQSRVLVQYRGATGGDRPNSLSTLDGDFLRDLDSDKRRGRQSLGSRRLRSAMALHACTLAFFEEFKPDMALCTAVEGFEAKSFIRSARELGIPVVVPTSCRHLGGFFLAGDDLETLAAPGSPPTSVHFELARDFMHSFRSSPTGADRIIEFEGDPLLPHETPALPARIQRAGERLLKSRSEFDRDYFRAALLNNLPVIRDGIWGVRASWAQTNHDVSALSDLPQKFVYFPLQYSPESSINTPAPFFVDQTRAIDALRYALPPDHYLVVKEHPACIKVRPVPFVASLRKLPGVVVARFDTPSVALIRRSAVTVSITGSATLEAYLLGRPALCLGSNLVSTPLGGVCNLNELAERLVNATVSSPGDDQVLAFLAQLFAVRIEANFRTPGLPGEPVLRSSNVSTIASALCTYWNLV